MTQAPYSERPEFIASNQRWRAAQTYTSAHSDTTHKPDFIIYDTADERIVTLCAVRYIDLLTWALEDAHIRLRHPALPGGMFELAQAVDLFTAYCNGVGIEFPVPSHLWFAASIAISRDGARRFFFSRRIKTAEVNEVPALAALPAPAGGLLVLQGTELQLQA